VLTLNDTPDNLHLLSTNQDALLASVEQLRRMLPLMTEMAPQIARTRYASYKAHIEAGFDEDQALELCRSLVF
jgi:hypothetical protein